MNVFLKVIYLQKLIFYCSPMTCDDGTHTFLHTNTSLQHQSLEILSHSSKLLFLKITLEMHALYQNCSRIIQLLIRGHWAEQINSQSAFQKVNTGIFNGLDKHPTLTQKLWNRYSIDHCSILMYLGRITSLPTPSLYQIIYVAAF